MTTVMDTVNKRIEKFVSLLNGSDHRKFLEELRNHLIPLKDKLKTHTAQKTFGVFINMINEENVLVICEALRFLIDQTPQKTCGFYLPIVYNKVMELEKKKQYRIGIQLVKLYVLNDRSKLEHKDISVVLKILQQCIYFFTKANYKNSKEVNTIISNMDLVSHMLLNEQSYKSIIDTFFGPSSNSITHIYNLQGATTIKDIISKKLINFNAVLDETAKTSLLKEIPKYITTVQNLIQKDNSLHGLDLVVVKHFQRIIKDKEVLTLLNLYCKQNSNPSLASFLKLATCLSKIIEDPKNVKAIELIETCFLMTRRITDIANSIVDSLDNTTTMQFFFFISNMIKVMIYCDNQTDRGACNECKNTKRHIADVLINAFMKVFESLAKSNRVNVTVIKYFVEKIQYKFQTIDGLKCSKKNKMVTTTLWSLYPLLIDKFWDTDPEYTPSRIKLSDLFREYMKKYKPNEIQTKHVLYICSKAYTDTLKQIDIMCLMLLAEKDHDQRKARANLIIKNREGTELESLSIVEIIKRKSFDNFDQPIPVYDESDLILLEMETIFSYSRKYDRNVQLFNDFSSKTSDVLILGAALFLLDLEQHNQIYPHILRKIEQDLLQSKLKTFKSEAILGLITFRKYVTNLNNLKEGRKDAKYFVTQNTTVDEVCKTFEILKLENEEEALSLLDKSHEYFTNAIQISKKENYVSLKDLYSCVKVRKTIENIAAQYAIRGIYAKSMQAHLLSYELAKHRNDEWGMIASLSNFVENIKQFENAQTLDLSIEEIVDQLENMIEKYLKDIHSLSTYKQSYVLSAHLYLIEYYLEQRKVETVLQMLKRFDAIDQEIITKNEQYESYFKVIRLKSYVLHYKLLVSYPDSSNLSPFAFLFSFMFELNDMVDYKNEFSIYIPTMIFKIILNLSLHQAARYDSKLMESYLMFCFKMAARVGMSMRCIEIYTLLIYLYLIDENLDEIEGSLNNLNRMFGYEIAEIRIKSVVEEILIGKKSSKLVYNENTSFNFEIPPLIGSAVRREAVKSPGPSLVSPQIDLPLSRLTKYIIQHNSVCICTACQLPQIKMYSLILGHLYARMMYLNRNYEVCESFYNESLGYWQNLKGVIEDSKDQILLRNFFFYSFYALTHVCHCLLRLKKLEEAKSVCDIVQNLVEMRGDKAMIEEYTLLKFSLQFAANEMKSNEKRIKLPSLDSLLNDNETEFSSNMAKIPTTFSTTTKKMKKATGGISVFIDSPNKSKMSPAQKKRLLFSKRKDSPSLDSPNLSNLCMGLNSIASSMIRNTTPKKSVVQQKAVPKTIAKISYVGDQPEISKKTSVRSTRKKIENTTVTEIKSAKLQISTKSTDIPGKKQLNFSPTLDSPVEEKEIKPKDKSSRVPVSIRVARKIPAKKIVNPQPTMQKQITDQPSNSIIVIDSDSETSVVDASMQHVKYEHFSARRTKRFETRTETKTATKEP